MSVQGAILDHYSISKKRKNTFFLKKMFLKWDCSHNFVVDFDTDGNFTKV